MLSTIAHWLFAAATTVAAASASDRRPAPQAFTQLYGRDIYQLSLNNATSAPAGTAILPVALADDKQSFYAVVSAGKANFRLALDTGSADTWLVSSDCVTPACRRVPTYPLAYQSPSFISVNNNNTAFNVSYADGTGASGFVALETIALGNVTVSRQAVGLARTSNLVFSDDISGVLGLGFPRLSTISASNGTATPIVATMAQHGLLSYPIFGVSLPRTSMGSLTFGAVDTSVLTHINKIQWLDVEEFSPFGAERNASGYLQWATALSSVNVGDAVITPQPTYPKPTHNTSIALLDIGTLGIFGPYQDVSRIFESIDGSRLVSDDGQWVVPCDTAHVMSFSFGNTNFTMKPVDYLIGPASGNPNACLAWPRAMLPRSDGIDWQLGTAFLSTVYSIFSYGINGKEPPMIGLYPLSNITTPLPYSSLSAHFSSASATVATTLPNSLLATPMPTAPAYAFNTSVPASAGALVRSDLGTSTYSPLLRAASPDLPTASPAATLATFIVTDSGVVRTLTSMASVPSVTLGVPVGWQKSGGERAAVRPVLLLAVFVYFVLWAV